MNKKILGLAFFISISPSLMADSFNESSTHHEAAIGSIGLIAGTIVAGPFGAIIGGSLGVMTGHHQTQTETISTQQKNYFISNNRLLNLKANSAKLSLT